MCTVRGRKDRAINCGKLRDKLYVLVHSMRLRTRSIGGFNYSRAATDAIASYVQQNVVRLCEGRATRQHRPAF
jgi:hypothetical protein